MDDKYFRDNEWWVSPYNFVPEVRDTYQLPKTVSTHDATLRDGEQTPGVVMSIKEKVEIAEKLDEIGVDRIEAGMPAVSDQDFEAIKQISKLGLKSKIYTFARYQCRHRQGHRMRLPWRHHRGSHRVSQAQIPVQVDLGRRSAQERTGDQLRQVARHARGVFSL